MQTKRVSKPSVGQKRSAEYMEDATQQSDTRKKARTAAALKAETRAKAGEMTAQTVSISL